MQEFKIPPISTLAGSSLLNFLNILRQGKIAIRYWPKIALTGLLIIATTPFRWWELWQFKRRTMHFQLEKPPLFIVGHWRSGTTLLHNLLTQDPNSGFITTYQSVFPNYLASKWLFKTFMKHDMPKKRPADQVALDVEFPQEDEFAYCNVQKNGYYNFFYFPREYRKFLDREIHPNHLSAKELHRSESAYDDLLKKAMLDGGGQRIVVKNPVNTFRIERLLKRYPDAKFLYLYRNPYTVFLSTRRFFEELFPTLWLHPVNKQFIDNMIVEVHHAMMQSYQQQKALIPSENLLELKYETFEANPLESLKQIYAELLNEDFDTVKHYFYKYLSTQKNHQKKIYHIDQATEEYIRSKMGLHLQQYGYSLPEEMKIMNNTK